MKWHMNKCTPFRLDGGSAASKRQQLTYISDNYIFITMHLPIRAINADYSSFLVMLLLQSIAEPSVGLGIIA